MASCYKTPNNKFVGCPARMADGRHFTDYRPSCQVNNLIRMNNNVVNSFDYRMYLANNATRLMDINRAYALQKNSCGPCMAPYGQGTMLPEKYMQVCNGRSCETKLVNPDGIGTGRLYVEGNGDVCPEWPTDLPRTLNNSQCGDPESMFSYYGDESKGASRYTSPSGGYPVGFNL